jgi:hypothetical protein
VFGAHPAPKGASRCLKGNCSGLRAPGGERSNRR